MSERALITTEAQARELAPEWDALAVAAGRPYCAPAWMLAWWRRLAPEGAELRIVALREGGQLVGVVPCFLQSPGDPVRELRLLCAGFTARIEPLAAVGHETALAGAAAELLGAEQAGLLALEGLPAGSSWPRLLADSWPGRGALLHRDFSMEAPIVELAPQGYDAWLAARSKSFRKEASRVRRRLAERGAVIRQAQSGELERAVGELVRLYGLRQEAGGSDRLGEPAMAALVDAGRALDSEERFGVWLLEAGDDIVAAELFVAAGTETSAWGGGFEPDWGGFAPSITLMLAAIESAAARGLTRVDLGEGRQPYKTRFTEAGAGLDWATLVPRGRGHLRARARLAPKHLRWWARARANRLPKPVSTALRRVSGRR